MLPNVNSLPWPNFPNANVQTLALPTVNFEVPALPELKLPQPNLPNVNIHPPSLPNLNSMEGMSTAVHRISDASLTNFGNAILSTIKFTGGIVIIYLSHPQWHLGYVPFVYFIEWPNICHLDHWQCQSCCSFGDASLIYKNSWLNLGQVACR